MRMIDDLKDIGPAIPNLYANPFNNDPTAVRFFIRGIGQNDVQITQDPSVALYQFEVYIRRASCA
jgi:iron complex outermembrane receptor protein